MAERARRWLDRFAGWPAVAGWAVVIFGLSSIPNNFAPSESAIPADKIAHAIEFAVLAVLVAWTLARSRSAGVTLTLAFAAAFISSAYGVTDEIHQRYVPGRDVTVGDFFADVGGAALGACVALTLGNGRVTRRQRPNL